MSRSLLILLLLFSACKSFNYEYGYTPNIDKITIGTEQAKIKKIIGPPSYISNVKENTWYYISSEANINIITPSSYSSKVLVLEFDDNNLVKNSYEIVKKDEPLPQLKPEITKRKGIAADKSFVEKITDFFKGLTPSL